MCSIKGFLKCFGLKYIEKGLGKLSSEVKVMVFAFWSSTIFIIENF